MGLLPKATEVQCGAGMQTDPDIEGTERVCGCTQILTCVCSVDFRQISQGSEKQERMGFLANVLECACECVCVCACVRM